MLNRFEDPWSRFAATGKIEDYLTYKNHFTSTVRSPSGLYNNSDIRADIALSKAQLEITSSPDRIPRF